MYNNVWGITEFSLDVKSPSTTMPTKCRHYQRSRIRMRQVRLSQANTGVEPVLMKILMFQLSWIFAFLLISSNHALECYLLDYFLASSYIVYPRWVLHLPDPRPAPTVVYLTAGFHKVWDTHKIILVLRYLPWYSITLVTSGESCSSFFPFFSTALLYLHINKHAYPER